LLHFRQPVELDDVIAVELYLAVFQVRVFLEYRHARLQGKFVPDANDFARAIFPIERPGRAGHDDAPDKQTIQLVVLSRLFCIVSHDSIPSFLGMMISPLPL
jgi:hypothetical protein